MVTIIATDGSSIRDFDENQDEVFYCAGGYVAEVYEKKERIDSFEEGKYLGKATNNIAELSGLIMGLKKVKEKGLDMGIVLLICDSAYMINSVSKWYYKWIRGLRPGELPITTSGTEVKNFDLITEANKLYRSCPHAKFLKIRSHVPSNELQANYKKFVEKNNYPCSYDLFFKFHELNNHCDVLVHTLAKNRGKNPEDEWGD